MPLRNRQAHLRIQCEVKSSQVLLQFHSVREQRSDSSQSISHLPMMWKPSAPSRNFKSWILIFSQSKEMQFSTISGLCHLVARGKDILEWTIYPACIGQIFRPSLSLSQPPRLPFLLVLSPFLGGVRYSPALVRFVNKWGNLGTVFRKEWANLKMGSHYVALAGLELTVWTILALNLQQSPASASRCWIYRCATTFSWAVYIIRYLLTSKPCRSLNSELSIE